MTPPSTSVRKTPLAEWHRAHGGRMGPSAGWELPLEFAGAASEHRAVRTSGAVFDLSHLGEIELAGRDALAAVQQMTSNDAGRLSVGEAQASALTTLSGTVLDDLVVYRFGKSHFLFLLNAANLAKDAAWITGQAGAFGDVAVVDTSSRYALLAVHGPASTETVQALTSVDVGGLEPGWFMHGEVAGVRATIARAGYTGETGYDIFTPPQQAQRVWTEILAAGADAGVVPGGLAACDTLRLEAGRPAYGSELDETTTLLEAGLEAVVAWDKGDFNGREALAAQKARGLQRRLVGFEMMEPAIAQAGCNVIVDGRTAGTVTSGAETPFLGKAIGFAYVPIDRAEPGAGFEVDVRGHRAGARVVPLPFYKRPKG